MIMSMVTGKISNFDNDYDYSHTITHNYNYTCMITRVNNKKETVCYLHIPRTVQTPCVK